MLVVFSLASALAAQESTPAAGVLPPTNAMLPDDRPPKSTAGEALRFPHNGCFLACAVVLFALAARCPQRGEGD